MATPARSAQTAADVMTVNPLCCDADSPVLAAVAIFREADCGAVPVLKGGMPVGILTDRDVALALAEHEDALPGLPVSLITTPGLVSVRSDDSLATVVQKFGEGGVRRLLVLDGQERLVGIIGWSDVAPHVSDAAVGHVVSGTSGSA